MSSLRFGVLGLLGSAGLFVVGCNPESSDSAQRPLDSTEATTAVNQRVDELIVGLGDSTARLDMTDSTTVATGSINQATGSSSSCTPSGSTGTTTTATSTVDDAPKSTTKALDDFFGDLDKKSATLNETTTQKKLP